MYQFRNLPTYTEFKITAGQQTVNCFASYICLEVSVSVSVEYSCNLEHHI